MIVNQLILDKIDPNEPFENVYLRNQQETNQKMDLNNSLMTEIFVRLQLLEDKVEHIEDVLRVLIDKIDRIFYMPGMPGFEDAKIDYMER